ncbi:hypothetical protein D3C75_1258400 [compost metagenome]
MELLVCLWLTLFCRLCYSAASGFFDCEGPVTHLLALLARVEIKEVNACAADWSQMCVDVEKKGINTVDWS